MSAVEQEQRRVTQRAGLVFAWPCVASIAGTMIGERLGSTLPEKLLAGVLIAIVATVLMAPGTRMHHRRRVVAVGLLLGMIEMLRGAKRALASSTRHDQRRPLRPSHLQAPANWAATCLAAAAGFGLGSLGTTVIDGWAHASGTKTVSIPDVRGDRVLIALRTLKRAKLVATSNQVPSESIPKGSVTRTSPPPGAQVRPRSTVKVMVSSGRRTVSVPDVRGAPMLVALRTLKRAELVATSHRVPSESVRKGGVTRTSPSAGARVPRRSTVKVIVSSGKRETTADGGEFAAFYSPSGNISCEMVRETSVWCQAIKPGQSATLSATNGETVVCVARGDPVAGAGSKGCTRGRDKAEYETVLGYGHSVRVDPFRCRSSESGVRCVIARSGDGFTISKQGVDASPPATLTGPP